jgi:predicted transcriptional regulator
MSRINETLQKIMQEALSSKEYTGGLSETLAKDVTQIDQEVDPDPKIRPNSIIGCTDLVPKDTQECTISVPKEDQTEPQKGPDSTPETRYCGWSCAWYCGLSTRSCAWYYERRYDPTWYCGWSRGWYCARSDGWYYGSTNTKEDVVKPEDVLYEYAVRHYHLTDQQWRILECIINLNGKPIGNEEMARETGVNLSSLKKTLRRFYDLKIIAKDKETRFGFYRGVKYKILDKELLLTDTPKKETRYYAWNYGWSSLIHYKEEEDVFNLLLAFPHMSALGLEKQHLKKIMESWATLGLNINDLQESFRRIEFALQKNLFPKVENPLAYFFAALTNGPFAKPKGYKSPAELQAEEILAEQKRIQEILEQAEDIRFNNMMADPDSKEYQICLEAIGDFARKRGKASSAFISSMKQAFRINCRPLSESTRTSSEPLEP